MGTRTPVSATATSSSLAVSSLTFPLAQLATGGRVEVPSSQLSALETVYGFSLRVVSSLGPDGSGSISAQRLNKRIAVAWIDADGGILEDDHLLFGRSQGVAVRARSEGSCGFQQRYDWVLSQLQSGSEVNVAAVLRTLNDSARLVIPPFSLFTGSRYLVTLTSSFVDKSLGDSSVSTLILVPQSSVRGTLAASIVWDAQSDTDARSGILI